MDSVKHAFLLSPIVIPRHNLSRSQFGVNCYSNFWHGYYDRQRLWPTSSIFIGASGHLFFTCLNYLGLTFLILSTTEVIPTLSQISLFLILCLQVSPHIHLNILIFATLILWTWELSSPYSTVPRGEPSFHSPRKSTMCDIIVDLPITLN